MIRNVIPAMCILLFSTHMKAQKTNNMEEVAVMTQFDVKKDQEKKFHKSLRRYVNRAAHNKNNIMAEAYHEEENTSVMWIIERWNSQRDLDKMRTGAKFKRVNTLSKKMLVQPSKMIYVKDLEPLSKEEWRREPAKHDKPITIVLFVDSKAGTEDKFKEVYHVAMPQFRSEPGVINYQLSQLQEDNTQFVTYEKFRNEAAFQYHLNFPPIQPVIGYLNSSIKKQPFQSGLHRLIRFAPSGK
jgi:quinol monooxygenase YgiN